MELTFRFDIHESPYEVQFGLAHFWVGELVCIVVGLDGNLLRADAVLDNGAELFFGILWISHRRLRRGCSMHRLVDLVNVVLRKVGWRPARGNDVR